MKARYALTRPGIALLVAAMLGTAGPTLAASEIIRIDGSSTVYPITEAVAEEFQRTHREARVTVGVSGTGGGFKKFCRGEINIAAASRPILEAEMAACRQAGIRYIELPVAYDALTVVVNPRNDWATTMTIAELRKIWEPAAQGKITRWNHVDPEWPDAAITLFGPGADSGTFDYFTEAVVGKPKASRGDFTASEDDNVLVTGVSRDRYALGYFGFAYYKENQDKLKAVAVDSGKGPVKPTAKTVEDGSYPLSRPVFIYVSEKSLDRPEVIQFVEYYLTEATELILEVGYVPLPGKAYVLAAEHLRKRKVGTVFGGKTEVGMRIEELLKREAKL